MHLGEAIDEKAVCRELCKIALTARVRGILHKKRDTADEKRPTWLGGAFLTSDQPAGARTPPLGC
jgi:hypothetical protein